MPEITYHIDPEKLTAHSFLKLVNKVWPGEYDREKTALAIKRTFNIIAMDGKELVGCVRLLSDGYFYSTITEILIDPAYQKQGIGKKLMELVFQASPSSLAFGVQSGNELFFEKIGYEKGLITYQKRKERNR